MSECAKWVSQDGQHKFPLGETLISDLISTPRELTWTIEEHVACESVLDKAGMGEGSLLKTNCRQAFVNEESNIDKVRIKT